MHNTNFTIQLLLIFFLHLGNTALLTAQRTTENYDTTACGKETMIIYGNDNIIMEGERAVNYSFKILDNRRKKVFECKENCGNNQAVADLPAGRYRVIISNENGRRICRKWVKLERPICEAKEGQLAALETRISLQNDSAILEAIVETAPVVPLGFNKIYLLTYGEDLEIINYDTIPTFIVNDEGNYRIHTLIIESASLNLDTINSKEVSIFRLRNYLRGNKNTFCSALDIKGARFRVRVPKDDIITGSGSGVGANHLVICNGIQLLQEANKLSISGEDDDGFFFKINDKENHLSSVFICRDGCEEEAFEIELPNSTYLVSIYNTRGRRICKETFEIAAPNNEEEAIAEGRSQTHFSFAANRAQRTVALEWLTNTGYKVSHFELEHSLNGVDFTKMEEFVNEDWSENMAYHQTTDATPAFGVNYYRVKQVYVDDSFKYSPIQQVDFTTDLDKTAVFPNPAQEALFVNLNQYLGAKGQLILSNQFGQQIQKIDIATIEQEILTINTTDIKNGVYYLNIQIDGYRVLSEKVLVQRFY